MGKKQIALSQCMITKNEEKNIEKALGWANGIVSEQIVADTGSTDATVQKALDAGAHVLYFEWIDDFAAAKNHALSQAKGDWVVFLDADEYFTEESAAKLMDIIENADANPQTDMIRVKLMHIDDDGSVLGTSCQDRIFRNDPKIRFRYRIHEELHHEDKPEMKFYDAQEELTVIHTGYAKGTHAAAEDGAVQSGVEDSVAEQNGQNVQDSKGERNARLLEKDIEENPRNATRMMYLGDAYAGVPDKKDAALDCYRKVLWDDGMEIENDAVIVRSGLQIMSMRQNEPAEDTQEEYLKIYEKLKVHGGEQHPDLDYYMGIWFLRANNLQQAAQFFADALEKLMKYQGVDAVRMTANLEIAYWPVALASLLDGRMQDAVNFAVSTLQVNRYSPEGIQVLLKAFMSEFKSGADAAPYWQFIAKLYDVNNLKDLLFVHKFAADAGFAELAGIVYGQFPEEVRAQLDKRG